MAEYIEREALKAKFMEHYSSEYAAALVLALIDNQPVAKVTEVRRGKWITNEFGRIFMCSKCSAIRGQKEKYCGNCGAKMDLEAVE